MKTGIILGALFAVALTIGLMWMSANNGEIQIKNKAIAQKEVCEAFFDKMWKIIQQKAQVTDEYKDAFEKIYPKLMEGRYATGGEFMKWVTESNPNFDVSLYKDLMLSIEAERTGFFLEQKKLTDIQNQHRTFRQTFPNSIFVGNRPDVPYVIVTSEKTKAAYETGNEDDIKLFQKESSDSAK